MVMHSICSTLKSAAPPPSLQITTNNKVYLLLAGGEEVEPVLKPVELELAGGEEVPGGLGDPGGGSSELLGLLESLLELLLPGSSSGGRGEGSRVPVGGVEGVDEGVHSGAVSARGDSAGLA